MTNKLTIGEPSKPRFEFRSFGSDFEEVAKQMARLSAKVPQNYLRRTSEEIYIVSKYTDINNTKIRDGKMDIKTLIQVVDGLEQWNPLMKGEFPMLAEMLETSVFPAFHVEIPKREKVDYTIGEFLTIVKTHPDLHTVTVKKERFGYMVNNTICEYARLSINNIMYSTVSTESTNIDDIKKTIKDLGLEGVENINYLRAVKRIVGIEKKT
jgi:hypothetical protein